MCGMKTIVLAVVCGAVLMGASVEDDVRKAEKDWAAAVVARDFGALERIYSDQLIYAHSTGRVETKAQYLDRLKSGTQQYEKIEFQNTTIHTYGDSAAALSHVHISGKSNGQPFDDRLIMLHLWVKAKGAWRLAAHQTTKMP
jgi:ketosteroid isomerase-like protein